VCFGWSLQDLISNTSCNHRSKLDFFPLMCLQFFLEQVAIRNVRRDSIKAYEKLEKVISLTLHLFKAYFLGEKKLCLTMFWKLLQRMWCARHSVIFELYAHSSKFLTWAVGFGDSGEKAFRRQCERLIWWYPGLWIFLLSRSHKWYNHDLHLVHLCGGFDFSCCIFSQTWTNQLICE
jgi:hypothetical protein